MKRVGTTGILDFDNVRWYKNGDDDFILPLGDYFLHVEKMHKKNWWWGVYYLDEQIYYGHTHNEHKETAMIKAEMNAKIHYLYHLIINK